MPTYSIRDAEGHRRLVKAPDLVEALRQADERMGAGWHLSRGRRWRTSVTERAWLWRQLADATREEAPLPQALARLADATTTSTLAMPLLRLSELTARGLTLADSLALVPQLGDEGALELLAAGEAAGRLPEALEALARLVESDADVAAKLRLRWVYPAFTCFVGLVALPVLASTLRWGLLPLGYLYKDLGVSLPLAAQSLVEWFSRLLPLTMLVVTALIVVTLVALARGWHLAPWQERWLYLLPGYGPFRFHRGLALFFKTLALQVQARLPADQALAAARKTLGGAVSAVAVRAEAAVREGKGLAGALAELELLPEPTLARLKAAEGHSLPTTLAAVSAEHLDLADFYARRFVTVLEPTMVVVVGLMVMAFAVALFGPLVSVVQTLATLTG